MRMVIKQVQLIGEMDCILQESNNDTKVLSPVKMKNRLYPMQLLWMRVRISLGDDHHQMVKNIGSNPIASTNTKIRNKKLLYNIMEKDIIKKITLKPVKCIRQSKENPYMRGLVMKRDLTTREACYIYRNIFLFDLDLSLDDFDDKDEKDYFYNDITDKMNSYIKGDVGWNDLCEATYCYDDDDYGASVACHLKLVEYLQKREVI
jgi:hypothetical protein